jgi:hypothetical protein
MDTINDRLKLNVRRIPQLGTIEPVRVERLVPVYNAA